MLPRILETEVMDTPEEARDYDGMDHAEVNRAFVGDFLGALARGGFAVYANEPGTIDVLDVGTGTALIPIELCRRTAACRVTAVDLAREMLKVAEVNVVRAGLQGRIRLEAADSKNLTYPDARFDAVMSNSIIHHIPEPRAALAEMLRVLRPGGLLFVRDLLRPPDHNSLERLVQAYAGQESSHARQMFRDSLHAALTLDEVRRLLSSFRLPGDWVAQTSDRHWTIAGRVARQNADS